MSVRVIPMNIGIVPACRAAGKQVENQFNTKNSISSSSLPVGKGRRSREPKRKDFSILRHCHSERSEESFAFIILIESINH